MNPTSPVWGHSNQPGLFQQLETLSNLGLGESHLTFKELQADPLHRKPSLVPVHIRVSMPLPWGQGITQAQ